MRIAPTVAFLALCTAVGLPLSTFADTIRAGLCVSWPGYSMLDVADEAGLMKGDDIAFTIFDDPIGGYAALAAGQIDVYACTADYTPLIAARGLDIVNVAPMNPSFGVDHIILDAGIEPADLAEKKVAAPQAYIGHLLMGFYLDSVGIRPDQVEWVNLNADEAVGPMLSGDLAAAYMYDPWISKVLAAKPGARSVVDTLDPAVLKTGIFMDALYMNKTFIKEHRDKALAVLKARWEGLRYWNAHTDETNHLIAEFLHWPDEDVQSVIGTNGKSFPGGIYMFDFDESARVCGVLDGEPPLGISNGGVKGAAEQTNEWWVRLGLMKKTVDVSKAIDCSLMRDLVKSGYREDLKAH